MGVLFGVEAVASSRKIRRDAVPKKPEQQDDPEIDLAPWGGRTLDEDVRVVMHAFDTMHGVHIVGDQTCPQKD